MGLFDATCQSCGRRGREVTRTTAGTLCPTCLAAVQAQAEAYEAALSRVVLTTGDIPRAYEIIDVIMALQAAPAWDVAWAQVNRGLRADAHKLGADAVVHIRVEHRVFVENVQRFFGESHVQGVEFFACGTAIRYR